MMSVEWLLNGLLLLVWTRIALDVWFLRILSQRHAALMKVYAKLSEMAIEAASYKGGRNEH